MVPVSAAGAGEGGGEATGEALGESAAMTVISTLDVARFSADVGDCGGDALCYDKCDEDDLIKTMTRLSNAKNR